MIGKHTGHKQSKVLIRGKLIKVGNSCIEMVKILNSIGLDTKYSCENPYYIMFEDYITDKQIMNFIDNFENKYRHSPFKGRFEKWCRKCNGKIILNWTYRVKNIEYANSDLDIMKEKIKNGMFV